jgi:hypothetical protein
VLADADARQVATAGGVVDPSGAYREDRRGGRRREQGFAEVDGGAVEVETELLGRGGLRLSGVSFSSPEWPNTPAMADIRQQASIEVAPTR